MELAFLYAIIGIIIGLLAWESKDSLLNNVVNMFWCVVAWPIILVARV